jgi:hypothetical protein
MTSRVIVLGALFAATGCMNTSQPRSRQAVLDQPTPPPAAATALTVEHAVAHPGTRPVDVPEVEMLPVPGSSLGRARATVIVRAALERVRTVLVDFPAYGEFMPHYKSAEVTARTPQGGMQVMMKIDALGGMIHRWMRVEVSAPVVDGARESFSARLLEGDVKAFEARWVLDRLADGTRLTLESFMDGNLQFPVAFLDAGNASGVKASILAIKARAEDGAP